MKLTKNEIITRTFTLEMSEADAKALYELMKATNIHNNPTWTDPDQCRSLAYLYDGLQSVFQPKPMWEGAIR